MGCGCNKGAAIKTADGKILTPGTYRVLVGENIVYESSQQSAAQTVADRFNDAKILAPGETA
ncbi:hypothetical protein SEA_MISCHIEF19_13 [Streptomyces phage Mischief19]|nr:hypothetical protein SEA_MISCHIEF19_13 [Streptomyces phage Mischief19]